MLWTIYAKQIQTAVRLGLYDHERQQPQRLQVDVTLTLDTLARPSALADSFDYERIIQSVAQEWPTRPHTDLVETLVGELALTLLASDERVQSVAVDILKTEILAPQAVVGAGLRVTRADLPALRAAWPDRT